MIRATIQLAFMGAVILAGMAVVSVVMKAFGLWITVVQ